MSFTLLAACSGGSLDSLGGSSGAGGSAGSSGAGGMGGSAGSSGMGGSGGGVPSELEAVPLELSFNAKGISATVELVRDDAGIPHIYGETIADVAFAQGYVTANDRFVQMDFIRRNASGTLSELFGESVLADDIRMRSHHLRATAQKVWDTLKASAEPLDRDIVAGLSAYAKGVNMWIDDVKSAAPVNPKATKLPVELTGVGYKPESLAPWTEVDSLVIGELQAFALSYEVDGDLFRTAAFEREKAVFEAPGASPELAARRGYITDLTDFRPFLPTYTVDGWGETDSAARSPAAIRPPLRLPEPDAGLVGLVAQILPTAGRILAFGPGERGSNNWVVSGSLSKSGHAMVANDTHLSLTNPALFYLVHLRAGSDFEVMGVQFPGVPLITLGFNHRVAWGATVSVLDVTDVYDEAVAPCGDKSCVSFKGQQVPLAARDETFRISIGGDLANATTKTVRLYDVPHHGPIMPRVVSSDTDTSVAPLGARELSVRYTGYDGYPIYRGLLSLMRSSNAADGRRAVEAHLAYGRQNWVLADVEGHIGWTQGTRLPRRPATSQPWKVMPGDGSAEWDGFFKTTDMPRAFDPAKGYLVTANADPVGVTADNDPMNEPPDADGFPRYIGTDYEPGARVARATQRIKDATAGGAKLDLDGMASVQADAISELGRVLQPHFVAAAKRLDEEVKTPGTHPDIAAAVSEQSNVRGFYETAHDLVEKWSLDTPAGNEAGITPAGVDDSRAALLAAIFITQLNKLALNDEATALNDAASGFAMPARTGGHDRLWPRLLNAPETLTVNDGDGNVLFDDLTTAGVVETREFILAKAVTLTLEWAFAKPELGADPGAWQWGKIHFVKPSFFTDLFASLHQDAYPRHGGTATVDVADPGYSDDNKYEFRSGPAIRFVCELDPVNGPKARNVVPGGQIFDRQSPHYKDQLELWAKNQTLDLPFKIADVVERAKQENAKNQFGRLRFVPTP